jgi:UTP:GlnB (protein PII) uridylyltransferase
VRDEAIRRLTGTTVVAKPNIDVVEVGASRAALTLDGSFEHPYWLAQLAASLAGDGVSIVGGSAMRTERHAWSASFDLDTSMASATFGPRAIAFALRHPPVRTSSSVRVLSWDVQHRQQDGMIGLRVTAEDEVGFLGRLLRRLALLALIPIEMHVATADGRLDDTFVLARVGGVAPSHEVEEALRHLLAASGPELTD